MLYLRNIFLFLILAAMIGCGEGTRHVEMVRMLEQAEEMNRDYVPMDTLQGIEELTDYFMAHGSAEERIRANYMMGSVYRDRGDSPMALEYFLKAVNQADTTAAYCNHELLSRIYAQMAQLFAGQIYPQKALEMWDEAMRMAKRAGDEQLFAECLSHSAACHIQAGDKPKAVKALKDAQNVFLKIGNNRYAASIAGEMASYYLKDDSLVAAKAEIDRYISDAKLYNDGQIHPGCEIFFYYLGQYYEKTNQPDSALHFYRKIAVSKKDVKDPVVGYRGLLSVYSKTNKTDSVAKYAALYTAANDSANAIRSADEVSRVQSLYDYTAHKQRALEKTEENHALWRIIFLGIIAAVAALLVIGALIFYHRQNERKRKRKIQELEQDLNNAKVARTEISEELRQLQDKDYESVIAAKEERLAELTETIEQLSQDGVAREKDNMEQFQNSEIAALFVKKATEKTEKVQPTEAEWKLLLSQFSQDNPATFKAFGTGKALSKLEQRICILLVLDIPEYVIAIMTNSSASTVSNSKARANEKLFGKKDARTLKINLIHAMKA